MIGWVSVAAAASATMQAERSELSEGQTTALQLIVTDGQVAGVPEIRAPEGLQIRYRAQSVQSYMVNFKTSTSVVYQYDLSALRAGGYTVGPLTLQSSKGALQVPAIRIEVRERQAQGSLDRVTAALPETLWAGQVAVYRMQFQTDRNLVNAQWTPPDPVGVAPEPALQPVTEESRVVQDGKTVTIEDLYYPVRAQSPGRHTIPGGVLQGQFAVVNPKRRQPMFGLGGFGEVSAEIFSSQPIPVEIKALPPGAPAGFAGLVGRFTLTATPSATTVAAGGTVTLDLRLKGDAPLSGLKLPPLEADGSRVEGFRVYDDQPTWTAEWVKGADGKAAIAAEAVFKRAIVPQSPGALTVPLPSFAYFDPVDGAYRIASADPITLQVTGDAGQAQVRSYGEAPIPPPDATGEDILPMRTQVRLARAWTGERAWWLLLPGAGLLLAQAIPGLRARLSRPSAPAEELPRLDRLPADPEARLAELDRILRLVLARRLGRRPDEIQREHLAALGDLAEEALEIYRAVEAARYRGGGIDEDRLRRLVDALGAR